MGTLRDKCTDQYLCKQIKESSKEEERICLYCSGNFPSSQKTLPFIDLEIITIYFVIEKFQLYLRSSEFTIRTDCENIVKFYNKTKVNKMASKRWLNFYDTITGNGYNPIFEHINGKQNFLADWLSRNMN